MSEELQNENDGWVKTTSWIKVSNYQKYLVLKAELKKIYDLRLTKLLDLVLDNDKWAELVWEQVKKEIEEQKKAKESKK